MRCTCETLLKGHKIACRYPKLGKYWDFFEQEGYSNFPKEYSHYGKRLPNGNIMRVWVTAIVPLHLGDHLEVRKWEEGRNKNGKFFKKGFGGVIFDPKDPDHFEKFKYHVLHETKVKFINREEDWEKASEWLSKK